MNKDLLIRLMKTHDILSQIVENGDFKEQEEGDYQKVVTLLLENLLVIERAKRSLTLTA